MRVKGTTHINRRTINSWVPRVCISVCAPTCGERDHFWVKHDGVEREEGGKRASPPIEGARVS